MTIRKYDDGEVILFNKNLKALSGSDLDSIKENISIVLQSTNFYKNLKVIELLHLFKSYYGKSINVDEIIENFQLEEHRKHILINYLVVGSKE